jgi:hypothetical protein
MLHPTSTWLFAGALLLGAAPAQIAKGAVPPAFPFLKTWNGAPASFDDFAGRVVILKFSESW